MATSSKSRKTVSIGGKNFKSGSKAANAAVSAGGTVSRDATQIRTNADASKAATGARNLADPLTVNENNGGTTPSYIPPPTITSANLTPTTGLNVGATPPVSNTGTNAMTLMSGAAAAGAVPPPTPEAANADAALKKLVASMNEAPESAEKILKKTKKEAGLDQKQQQVNTYQAQLNAIVAKSQADKLALVGQGRGVEERIIGGIQAQIDREAAIQSLPIAAQLSAAQNDLQAAQDHVDTYFKIRLEDAQAKYDRKIKVNELAYNYADSKQKAALEERRRVEDRNYDTQRDNLNYARDLANLALSTGQSSLAASILKSDMSAESLANYASGIRVPQKSTGSGGSTTPLGILDIARYNELYPGAGVVPGDSEAVANAKVAASNSPAGQRAALVAGFASDVGKVPYADTVKAINSNPAFADKAAALSAAAEAYGVVDKANAPPSKIEQEIAQLSKSGILNAGDVRASLKSRGYSYSEIYDSSAANFIDKISYSLFGR